MDKKVVTHRTRITVQGQIFDIPTEKVGELLGLLSKWQSISVSESGQQNGQTNNGWDGQNLIFG